MNASQRRITRRSTLRVLPVGTAVFTPSGAEGKVRGVTNGGMVVVQLKNNRKYDYGMRHLSRAA